MKKIIRWIIGLGFVFMPWFAQAESHGLVSIRQEFNAFKNYFTFNPDVLKSALEAYDCGVAAGYSGNPYILTVVDYQLPSYEKRLWVLDLAHHRILYHTYVAHGAGSGLVDATRFSNSVRSDDSSIGLYNTGDSYSGEWGYSMRLYGLDRGYNSNAFRRAIVMHGGSYVSPLSVALHGMIGMSHGCFAVPQTLSHDIINNLKGGSLIFAYYPDPWWLAHSQYLHCSVLHGFGQASVSDTD